MAVNSLSGATDPINKGIVNAKGDLIAGTQDNTVDRVAVGNNEQRLVANSASATGLSWVSDTTNYAINAKGDILAGSAADTVSRLPVGTNGQVLTANSASTTGLAWTTLSSSAPIAIYSSQSGTRTATVSVPAGNYVVDLNAGSGATLTIGTNSVSESSAINVASPLSSITVNGVDGESPARATSWTTGMAVSIMQNIDYNGSTFVIAGWNNYIGTSSDGITWTSRTSNFGGTSILQGVAHGSGIWLVGQAGGPQPGAVARSIDNGATWTNQGNIFPSGQGILTIEYLNNIFFAVGNGGNIRTSTNGSTWVTVTSNFGSEGINNISYNGSIFIAGGNNGQIRTSTNGSAWVTVTSNFGTTTINSISYGNGLWIAGGYGTRFSTNGVTWTTGNTVSNSSRFHDAVFATNRWVAAMQNGVQYSNVLPDYKRNFYSAVLYPSPTQAT